MAVNFSETLIVAISATALFDLTQIEKQLQIFMQEDKTTVAQRFQEYMQKHENDPLAKGSGFALIESLLNLNRYQKDKDYHDESPFVEVVVISKSTPDMGICVLNAIRHHKLPISRSAFISGDNVSHYIDDFGVDLFLTTNTDDAQMVVDEGICACAILDATPIDTYNIDTNQLRIAFDGDAVLFDDSGELIYQKNGLKAFHDRESAMVDLPIDKGPYADFLIKLSALQQKLPKHIDGKDNPISIALVTARNAPADMRAIKTLRQWGVSVDMAFFLGGLPKTDVLKSFAPHIFFDDSLKHINDARTSVPSALVPYHSNSLLNSKNKDKLAKQKIATKTFYKTKNKLNTPK